MNFKKYFIIFTLFIVLIVSISTINAASDDNITSEINSNDDSISHSNEDSVVNNKDVNNLKSSLNLDNSIKENQSNNINSADNTTSKSDLKITTYTNFIKNGNKYYIYLMDSNGNPVANKKLNVKFNGKIYKKTTDNKGKVDIKIKSSKSTASIKVTFSGDEKYNSLSKNLKIYITNSISITIGNSKLLTNGYLRIYLKGSKKLISHKNIKIVIGNKSFIKKTCSEGFIILKPKVKPGTYTVHVKYNKFKVSKKIKCIEGNVSDPLKTSVPTKNGVPDIDSMSNNYILADNNAKYTLKKTQYREVLKRDSYCLFLKNKLPKYTFFKSKSCPNTYHIIKREKWNVIERAINTIIVKKNRYSYWPSSVTVSLKGKAYTYSEVRDIQNSGVTCGATSASVCSQVLKNYYSEKYFAIKTNTIDGVNIPVLKKALDENKFTTYYFHEDTINAAVKQLKNGSALIAFIPNHYVAIVDVSPDGKKILVSNSYGGYNEGGLNRVPTKWITLKYFKTKFAGVGLVVKLDSKLSNKMKNQINNYYSGMGTDWQRQNTNERIPNIGL